MSDAMVDRARQRLRGGKQAGYAVMAFSVFMLASTIVWTFLADSFRVDVSVIAYFFLGYHTARASRSLAKWALALSVWYVLMAAVVLVVLQVAPHRVHSGHLVLSPRLIVLATTEVALLLAWSAVNLALLARFLSISRPARSRP